MVKKKSFIDKKASSTYHLLYRSQRDVAEAEEGGESGVILWPSPNNNKDTDQKVLYNKADAELQDSTLNEWKNELTTAGLVDDYDYDKHMKPITGSGDFFGADGKRSTAAALQDPRSNNVEDERVNEVDRQLNSIALTPDCMDDDIAQAMFGDFDDNDFEALDDDFMLDAAKEPDAAEDAPFDFAAHIKGLMEKAKRESEDTNNLATTHEQGRQDQDFFSSARPLGHDDDDESYYDGADWDIEGTPGVVAKLNAAEEKALVDKFNQTLLEYDSDDVGEGYDEEGAMGNLPLEGDKLVEKALDDYLLEKEDDLFMQGPRHYMSGLNKGGNGFSALVGTKMVPLKDLDKMENPPQDDIQPLEALLGDADTILGDGRAAPPIEDVLIDGKSYFSEKMRNPWDCESILSTYSNLDNNPSTIAASGRRRTRKSKKDRFISSTLPEEEEAVQPILLSEKTGLPLGVLPTREEEYGDDTFVSVNRGESRKKDESLEEKKLRKQNIKKERQVARMQKKMMKEAFSEEFGRRTQEILTDDVGGKTVFRF
jgi:protein LTV1